METPDRKKQKLIDKFKPLLHARVQGGIFTKKTRRRLLEIDRQTGPGRDRNQFWYRRREQVKTALKDLQLFIKVADISNVNQVITQENLKPVVEALLWHPVVEHAEPDLNRAEIAHLFIQAGFDYLASMKPTTLSHRRTIEEAIDLSKYLVSAVPAVREAFRERRERLDALVSDESKNGGNKP